ncbi:AGE family epimerase/isomerase [Ancylobacter sp.]|uniref:AGE family epimerase/isomerase n=1 Tax=Ancylobacter sp. TaxID=1872567 RepID=UPI003D0F81D2
MMPFAQPDRAPAPSARALPRPLSVWLTDRFLPLWAARALEGGQPGYIEAVGQDGRPLSSPQTTLVTARLVYTFSLGHELAGGDACRVAAAHGLTFLREACRLADGRFAHRPVAEGEPAPAEADLYELAFVLLALAGYAGAFGADEVLALIAGIADDLDGRLAHPQGGYRDTGVDGALRRQFPHMHLFEACQILARLQPGTGWERRCEAILDLVEQRLIAAEGSIAEWYAADWSRAGGTMGAACEIGHQFEWSWMLGRYGRMSGSARAQALGSRLYQFGSALIAEPLGRTPYTPLPNALDAARRPIGTRRPLWPLTEVLRASLEMEAGDDAAARPLADLAARRLFEHHLDPLNGLWINETDAEGGAASDEIPLRVLYHLLPALAAYSQRREGAFAGNSVLFDR